MLESIYGVLVIQVILGTLTKNCYSLAPIFIIIIVIITDIIINIIIIIIIHSKYFSVSDWLKSHG